MTSCSCSSRSSTGFSRGSAQPGEDQLVLSSSWRYGCSAGPAQRSGELEQLVAAVEQADVVGIAPRAGSAAARPLKSRPRLRRTPERHDLRPHQVGHRRFHPRVDPGTGPEGHHREQCSARTRRHRRQPARRTSRRVDDRTDPGGPVCLRGDRAKGRAGGSGLRLGVDGAISAALKPGTQITGTVSR